MVAPLVPVAVGDGERMVTAIEGADGKRLMYQEPVALK